MPDTPTPSARKLGLFRRAYYTTDSTKVRALAAMLNLATDKGAGHVVREYLWLIAEQHRQLGRMLRFVTPRAPKQDELPLGETAMAPAQLERAAGDYAMAVGRKSQVFEAIVTAAAETSDAAGVLRECLRMEVRQHKLAMRMLQALTPRAAGSMSTQVLNLLDEKPVKIWAFSVILARVLREGEDVAAVTNNLKQALYSLVHDGMVDRVGQGLYRSVRDATD